jgi:hypothetical protein
VLGILGALCLTTGAAATAATFFRMDALAWIIATTLIVLMIRLRVFGHREFGLIHQLLRRQAGNLAQSLFPAKSSPPHQIDSHHFLEAKTAEERPEEASPHAKDSSVAPPQADHRKAA